MTAPGLVLYSGTVIQATSFQQRLEAAVAGGFGAVSFFPHDYLACSDGASDEDLRSAFGGCRRESCGDRPRHDVAPGVRAGAGDASRAAGLRAA